MIEHVVAMVHGLYQTIGHHKNFVHALSAFKMWQLLFSEEPGKKF